jgi:hypothetical protein
MTTQRALWRYIPRAGKRVENYFEVVMFRKLAAECFGTFWLQRARILKTNNIPSPLK